jgi:hypothetical protein
MYLKSINAIRKIKFILRINVIQLFFRTPFFNTYPDL